MDSTRLGGQGSVSPGPDIGSAGSVHNYAASTTTGDGNADYIISDYMERLGERLNILETELKYAWRALDLLSQEYIKMWERLEKLEGLLCEQQTVISQLIDVYTTDGDHEIHFDSINGTATIIGPQQQQQSSVGELDAIAKSLGPAMGIEDTSVLREKLAQQEFARIHGLTQQDNKNAVSIIVDMHRSMRNLDALETLEEETNLPDEAFYRSLNNAYREDLICGETSRSSSQLGMIWEEAEDVEDSNGKKDLDIELFNKDSDVNDKINDNELTEELTKQITDELSSEMNDKIPVVNCNDKDGNVADDPDQDVDVDADEEGEIFSAADYKSYRGNTPCVSEQDLAQLSQLSSFDNVAMDKLHKLETLTSKLQKDSQELIELNSRLMESPKIQQYATEAEAKLAEEANSIDEQLRKIYAETDVDNWTYSKSPGSTGRSLSRVSTDSGLATDGDFTTRSISPRLNTPKNNNHLDSLTSVYTQPRLAYTTSLLDKNSEPVIPLPIDPGNYAKGYAENKELTDLMADSFIPTTCSSPTIFNSTTDKLPSPTLSVGSVKSIHSIHSVQSIRTRRDGYFGSAARLNFETYPESRTPPSPSPSSPPPPAPRDSTENFIIQSSIEQQQETDIKHLKNSSILRSCEKLVATIEQGKLSPRTPHSPKSPRASPKHIVKPININISDSGLSSMSGWSSMDKSPTSPKSSLAKILTSYNTIDQTRTNLITNSQALRSTSPIPPLPELSTSSTTVTSTISTSTTVLSKIPPGQEPLYDTPEGRDAFGNITAIPTTIAMNSTHLSSSSLNHIQLNMSTKSPSSKEDYNFVPPPAPTSTTLCPSPKKRGRTQSLQHTYDSVPSRTMDFIYSQDQPAIYSLAGNNRQHVITGVYSSGTSTGGPYGSVRTVNSDQFYNNNSQSMDNNQYSGNFTEPYNSLQYSESMQNSYPQGKKPTRAMSFGEGMTNHENYKATVYKNMFPTGNITDALSYYPTSVNLPRTETTNDSNWRNIVESQIPHDSTSSSIRSLTSDGSYTQSPYTDRRYPQPPAYQSHQYQQQQQQQQHPYSSQNYPQSYQQQYQPYNQRLPNSESAQLTDAYQRQWQRDNNQYAQETAEITKPTVNQSQNQPSNYYDASNVIVSQSGYISIAADIKDHEEAKVTKKIRRGASLKNAMSSMSHWLPDLHLSKRHRSHSLPGNDHRDDADGQPSNQHQGNDTSARGRTRPQPTRKKKKHILVSTVSGILQKAKRRSHSSQSQSDTEQSETEWSSGRQSGLDTEDEDMSDINQDPPFFAKVRSSTKRKGLPSQQQISQQQPQQQQPQVPSQQSPRDDQPLTFQQHKEYLQQQQIIQQQQQILQQQIQQHQELLQQQIAQENWQKEREMRNKHENSEHELSDNLAGPDDAHDGSGKSTGSGSGGSTNMFPTVGDIKRSTGSSDEAPNEKTPKLPSVSLMGGASMEFAVSRALGKYRQRQSSTVSDDQGLNEDFNGDRKSDDGQQQYEGKDEQIDDEKLVQEKNDKISNAKPPELVTSLSEEAPNSEGSPSASSTRGSLITRYPPRHQQSLEIPWAGSRSAEGDEDNRSTHSYRSTSRVSSRRQSTEDSIDSEDEWYCYELRKLEELERQSQIEIEMGKVLVEEPEGTEPYQPGEDVKERMSFVLKELRLKAVPTENDEKPEFIKVEVNGKGGKINGDISLPKERRGMDDGKPIPKKKSAESLETVFARVTDYHTWAHEEEARREERTALLPMDEGSSGETSGPDSPGQSMDELDEELDLRKDLEEQSRRSSNNSMMRKNDDRYLHGSDSLSREGSTGVPPSELSVSIPGGWDSESYGVNEGERDDNASIDTNTISLPKIKIDSSSCGSSDITLKEEQISPGPPGSKWKLLKALKERKAENKLKEVEDATAKDTPIVQTPTSVSIMIK